MKIEKNSRQMPSDKHYLASKTYSDRMYGYLQSISVTFPDMEARFVKKEDCKFVNLAEELGITRQTASKNFHNLLDSGLIIYNEEVKMYELVVLDSNIATLLPINTVRVLVNTLKKRSLSVLAILIKIWYKNEERPEPFSLSYIKAILGLSTKDKGASNQTILDILFVLNKLDLIEYHTKMEGNKTKYYLDSVNNTLNFNEEEVKAKIS